MNKTIVGAGTNKQHQTTKNTAKLDRESEELKHDKISLDVGKIIQQGRQSKGLSQKDLATVSGFMNFFFDNFSLSFIICHISLQVKGVGVTPFHNILRRFFIRYVAAFVDMKPEYLF